MDKPPESPFGRRLAENPDVALLIERGIAAGLFPGAAAAWGRAGRAPAVAAVGASRLRPRRVAAIPETRYDLASLTKPLVVAPLFLMAMREGRVKLETRADTFIPELNGTAVGNATMKRLLTHTSGLPAWHPLYAETRGDPSRLFDAFANISRPTPGDGSVVYSCLGYILLGKILERVFRSTLDRLFTERVARPLGLENESGFRPQMGPVAGGSIAPDAEIELLRQMSRDDDIRFIPPLDEGLPDDGNARFLGGVAGNAGLFGTARAVFVLTSQFIEGASQLFSSEEILMATRDLTPESPEQGRGLGWQLARSHGCSAGRTLPPTAFGHTGFTGTSVWADPASGLIAVFLSNRHHPGHRGVDLHPFRRRYNDLIVSPSPV